MKIIVTKNPEMTLKEWFTLVVDKLHEYGDDTVMYVDAGKSDCQLVIKEKSDK